MEKFKQIVQWCVMVAGFLNAFAIGLQAYELMQTKDSTGFSVIMFFVFLFIQASLAANGIMHKDKWQTSGMIASMATTIWAITLIFLYR